MLASLAASLFDRQLLDMLNCKHTAMIKHEDHANQWSVQYVADLKGVAIF